MKHFDSWQPRVPRWLKSRRPPTRTHIQQLLFKLGFQEVEQAVELEKIAAR